MRCEYDDEPLPVTPAGEGDACPACAADIEPHLARCTACRGMLERLDSEDRLTAVGEWMQEGAPL